MSTDLKAIWCLCDGTLLDPCIWSPPGDDSLRSVLESFDSLGREEHADPNQEGRCRSHESRDGCVADHLQAGDTAKGGENDEKNANRNHGISLLWCLRTTSLIGSVV